MDPGPDWTNATPPQMYGHVLRPHELLARAAYGAADPDPRLTRWVDRYWSVRWEFAAGEVFHTSTLEDPSIHLTVERGGVRRAGTSGAGVWVTGPVAQGRFDVSLTGSGGVVGVKFRVGGVIAFGDYDLGAVRDRTVPAHDWFGEHTPPADLPLDAPQAAPALDAWLLSLTPREPSGSAVFRHVLEILESPDVASLATLSERTGMSVRTLQRLFGRFAGVGAKRMLVRARVMDAVAAIDRGDPRSMTALAYDLGWFDQSHFVRDFRTFTGETPGGYAERDRGVIP